MKNKLFTVVEIAVYMFILSIIGVYLVLVISNFFSQVSLNKSLQAFTTNYDNVVKNLYSNNDQGRKLDSSTNSGLVLINNTKALNNTGYIGYTCSGGKFGITKIFTGSSVDFDNLSVVYDSINCNNLTGWKVNSGYWIGFDILIGGTGLNVKYYFFNDK